MDAAIPVAIALSFLGAIIVAIPSVAVDWAQRGSPDVVFRVDTEERVVALSIDDGPSEDTPEILEILEEHGAGATFFLIGENVERLPDVARKIVEAGHEVGHHMMEDRPSRDLPDGEFDARFDEMDRLLDGLGGGRVFRPGSGWYDDRMIHAAEERGYRTVLGSVYPFDAHLPFAGFSSWYVRLNAGPGSIIVLHEGEDRGARTAEVLRTVLPELTRRGYEVVTVSKLLAREEGG